MISAPDTVLCFKAMADETRLNIISMLAKENLCACHILEAFSISQPTLSYHMKILVESGLVTSEKDGNWKRYKLDKALIKSIRDLFNDLSVNETSTRVLTEC